MAARTHLDDKTNTLHIEYDTPEDLMDFIVYKPGDPLYEKGIGSQILLNLPQYNADGKPEIVQKVLDVPVRITPKEDQE